MRIQISRRSRCANCERRTSPKLLARRLQQRPTLRLDARKIGRASVAARLTGRPGIAQEGQPGIFRLLHDPQRLAHNLACRGVAATRNLGLDEFAQFFSQRDIHVHGGQPFSPNMDATTEFSNLCHQTGAVPVSDAPASQAVLKSLTLPIVKPLRRSLSKPQFGHGKACANWPKLTLESGFSGYLDVK